MNICLLGSGSEGNCIYIEHRGTAILIDQGFAHREIEKRMKDIGLDPDRIRALLVSHEHGDHMKGVGITARKLGVPVYATKGTLSAKKKLFYGEERLNTIVSGEKFTLGPLEILPFSIPHDASEPVQYVISNSRRKIGIATDLGFVSTLVRQCMTGTDLTILEANHDVDMLKNGTYPWHLKQRIMGRMGHLSNKNAAELLFNLTPGRSTYGIILAHLSRENNCADIAEREVRELFARFDRPVPSLVVACQDTPTAVIEL